MKVATTWIEIDQAAFNHNVYQYKQVIGDRQLALVIKANAYGHGLHEIAQLAQRNSAISWLHVVSASEALELRRSGIKKPILILATCDQDPALLINQQIDCTIYDMEMVNQLNQIGKKQLYRFPIHVKIDTGLSRLGFEPKEAIKAIKIIKKLPFIKLQGIYSHFSESSSADQSFTLKQINALKGVIKTIQKAGIDIPLVHLANSAGTTAFDLPFCNLFRVGIGIYGLWPSEENKKVTQMRYGDFNLKPILTWKTRIINIKKVKKGRYIGYDRTFQAPHDMNIATIPIGYFDGYDFRLFNKASVLIGNQYARVIGRISMNITIIDVTDITRACVGQEVIIMGPYPGIYPQELGVLAGNPNVREITTKINAGITRVVKKNSVLIMPMQNRLNSQI